MNASVLRDGRTLLPISAAEIAARLNRNAAPAPTLGERFLAQVDRFTAAYLRMEERQLIKRLEGGIAEECAALLRAERLRSAQRQAYISAEAERRESEARHELVRVQLELKHLGEQR